MDDFANPNNAVAFTVWLLLLLINCNDAEQVILAADDESDNEAVLPDFLEREQRPLYDTSQLMRTTFQNFRLCASLNVFHDECSYWVKPRSTTWFSRFLLHEYDNTRWVSMFRMTKVAVFSLAEVIRPHVEKKNTKYRLAVPVLVRVACTLFKLTHAANLTICSEMFAIGRSTVSKILREVVTAINDCLRHEITWPTGHTLRETQAKFCNLCSLPAVVGAIDGTHISISKPRFDAADYFYFKTGGYSMNCQAVVDSEKRFLDLYIGMPGSTNDARMLRRSSLFQLATHGNLFASCDSVEGFSPYVIGDSAYPLLPWLIVPHKEGLPLSISESLLNRKLKKGRSVVENAFGILKQSFRELLGKSDLQITFLPDVIVCCAILHNILLRQSHDEVEEFLQVLHSEGLDAFAEGQVHSRGDGSCNAGEETPTTAAIAKRLDLGVYLTSLRRQQL